MTKKKSKSPAEIEWEKEYSRKYTEKIAAAMEEAYQRKLRQEAWKKWNSEEPLLVFSDEEP